MNDTQSNTEQLKQKYFQMAKSIGVDQTISILHNEVGVLEQKVFDGGFDRDKFEQVQQLRELSRELWTMRFKV